VLRALKTAIMCTLAAAIRDKVHSAQPHRAHEVLGAAAVSVGVRCAH
jgi:hypothetical protein